MRHVAILACWLVLGGAASAQTPPPSRTAPTAAAEAPVVTWGAELATASQYIWRGIEYSTGAVIWPSGWVSAKGFTFTVWANLDPDYNSDGVSPVFNEHDLSIAYTRTVGKVSLTGTYLHYGYREAPDVDPGSTSEVIARVGYGLGPGEIFTTHAFDVDTYRGSYYLEAGYAFAKELGPRSTLKVDGSLSVWPTFIEKNADNITDSTFGPATLNIALVQRLAPFFAVRPHVTFMRVLDSTARRVLSPPGAIVGIAAVFGR